MDLHGVPPEPPRLRDHQARTTPAQDRPVPAAAQPAGGAPLAGGLLAGTRPENGPTRDALDKAATQLLARRRRRQGQPDEEPAADGRRRRRLTLAIGSSATGVELTVLDADTGEVLLQVPEDEAAPILRELGRLPGGLLDRRL